MALREHILILVNNSSVVSEGAYCDSMFSRFFKRENSLGVHDFSVLTPHLFISCVVSTYKWKERYASGANSSYGASFF